MNKFEHYSAIKTCRTCLHEHGAIVPLFNLNYENICPSEMLTYINIQILENDGLPAYICENCNYKLTIAFDFCKLAKTSFMKLTEHMKITTPSDMYDSTMNEIIFGENNQPKDTIETILDIGSEKDIENSQYFIANSQDLLQTPVKDGHNELSTDSERSSSENVKARKKKVIKNAKKVKPIKSKVQLDQLLAKHQTKLKSEKSSTVKIFKQQRKTKVKVTCKPKESCHVCGKSFQYKGYLECHLRTHTQEKPFTCQICGKKFGQSSNLALHIKIHNNERSHQCEICSKLFVSNSNLMAHKRSHSDVRNFHCSVCELSFKTQKDLTRHSVVHTDVKSYSCEICAKKFHKRAYLNSHMRTVHIGEKKYHCKECGKQFSSSSNLTCHFRIHSGLKPYACKYLDCTAKFNQSQALRRHQRSHGKPMAKEIEEPGVEKLVGLLAPEIPQLATQDICFNQTEEQRPQHQQQEMTFSHHLPVYHHTTNELLQHEPQYVRLQNQPFLSNNDRLPDILTPSLHQDETQMINILSDQSSIGSSNDSNTFNFHATIPPTIPSSISNFENYYKIPPYQHQYSEYDIQQQYNTIHNQYSELSSFSKLTTPTPNNGILLNNYIGLPYQ